MAILGFDPSTILGYYTARLPLADAPAAHTPSSSHNSPTAPRPPWDIRVKSPSQQAKDSQALSADPYFKANDPALLGSDKAAAGSNSASLLGSIVGAEISGLTQSASPNGAHTKDNNRLFALYQALTRLDYVAQLAKRGSTVDGQLPGLDKRFQDGFAQILSFIGNTKFDNLTVLPGAKTSSVQSTATIPYPPFDYAGGGVVKDTDILKPMANVGASDGFTVSVTKGGLKTDIAIDLANVPGALTIDNIAGYINQQLAAAGFSTRFARAQTGGSIVDGTASWGLQIASRGGETLSLSSGGAASALYIAGSSGTPADSQGKLVKLAHLDTAPQSVFSTNIAPDSGTATAKATAVDANGNVYVVGNTTGSFGGEINQAAQDVYLTKYDSAGNVQWTKLLGSAGNASAYGLGVDPASGGVVVAGSVTGPLTPASIGGDNDSFVAKYDKDGNQAWVHQVSPLSDDQALAVSTDSSGNIYVGGQVSGAIASGAGSSGGADAYVTKLDAKGNVAYQRQFGTSGSDQAAKTAIAADGGLLVASVQNGHAILGKYAAGDGTSSALWQMDLGDLQGGAIGGLTVSGDQIYVSGATSNAALDAGGQAAVVNANSGGADAFVFGLTDQGASATPGFVSYAGTGVTEQGGAIAVAGGEIYLTGTTTGTFAGQNRSSAGTHNMFVAQFGADGTLGWTRQYGGADSQSQGFSIAADAQGASVLDALGLPRGIIASNQSSDLASQTTVRAGDYFTLQIQGKTGVREARITVEKGETLRSLATKINGALLFDGKAQALPASGGQALKIQVNAGVQVQLVAGPKDFDALAGLGIAPGLLVNDSKPKSSASNISASSITLGLGLKGGINLASKTNASHAEVVLQAALSLIKQTYSKLNAPPAAASGQPAGGPVPAYLQTQIASYQTALDWLSAANTGTTGTTATSLF